MIARRIWRNHRFLRPFSSSSVCAPPFRVPEYHSQSFASPISRPFHAPSPTLMKWSGGGVSRNWYSNEAMSIDSNARGGFIDVPLAQTGEGIAECELLKWFVKEGDHVEEFQPLCEVQSDKATIEITSRFKGKVALISHAPGDIIKVGETLVKLAVEDAQEALQVSSDTPGTVEPSVFKPKLDSLAGALSTPAVRNLAKDLGIDINLVIGSGKDGRVLKEDVLRFSCQKGSVVDSVSSDNVVSTIVEDQIVPLRGFNRAMVKTMTMATKVPHFHFVEEINCDALVKLKHCFKENNADSTVKHTFLPTLIKSLSMALTKYPFVNGCFNEEALEIILKGSHNIGVAMATEHGLVVPNIKNVQLLSLLEITKELSRLQHLATNNKLSPEDVTGGTITLSNIGAIGGKFGSPLLNLPEVAIIALGRIEKVPKFKEDGSVYPASAMMVNIAADHRVLDGATVARFCCQWKEYIEKPELLMLQMR
ncbi:Lipoamide acyltransferase component of branched-chain alpha-keto acid dehydrogenase complex [Hirschfeldia incana]|nr:Lipoamide acyltransferase component of branched-chain alpha-keto acid dehydrogenase complex [Hirschfeldia incana]